jgi:hypothetical protein
MQGVAVTYEDLLIVPYKENGRDTDGMDCYGFVIELLRRAGKNLADIAYLDNVPEAELYEYVCSLGAIEREQPEAGLSLSGSMKGFFTLATWSIKNGGTHDILRCPRDSDRRAIRRKILRGGIMQAIRYKDLSDAYSAVTIEAGKTIQQNFPDVTDQVIWLTGNCQCLIILSRRRNRCSPGDPSRFSRCGYLHCHRGNRGGVYRLSSLPDAQAS